MSSNFHLFIALAILEKHRDVIMEYLKHFDEVLPYRHTRISFHSRLLRHAQASILLKVSHLGPLS